MVDEYTVPERWHFLSRFTAPSSVAGFTNHGFLFPLIVYLNLCLGYPGPSQESPLQQLIPASVVQANHPTPKGAMAPLCRIGFPANAQTWPFLNQVLWESRGPLQPDRSVRTSGGLESRTFWKAIAARLLCPSLLFKVRVLVRLLGAIMRCWTATPYLDLMSVANSHRKLRSPQTCCLTLRGWRR